MNNLKNIFVICCLIGILNSFVNSCKTPNSGVDGSCRALKYCRPLKKTMKRRFGLNENYDWQNGPKSTQMTNFLKKYKNLCKNNKVCCGDLLPFSECGDTISNNIYGGKKTRMEEFSWMAVLQYKYRYNEITSGCDGSLISNKYVLTAAYCIRWTLHSVVLGEHMKGIDPDCKKMPRNTSYCTSRIQTFLVDSYVMHADYKPYTKENDIALIRLKGDADTSKPNVKTICIAPPNTEPEKGDLTITGWRYPWFGSNSRSVSYDILLKHSLIPKPLVECKKLFANSAAVITNKQLCAVNPRDEETCVIGSGSPAFNVGLIPEFPNDPKFMQHGIFSFSMMGTCGTNETYTMYTKISSYYYWILDNMQP